MSEIVNATYKNGVFIPEKTIDFPDGSEVQLEIELKENFMPDREKKAESVREFLNRTGKRSISSEAPVHFTREELHERG